MKNSILFLVIFSPFFFLLSSISAQQVNKKQKIDGDKSKEINKPNETQAVNDKITFKDGSTTLLEINSEVSAGSIILPSVGSILSDNKLYNNGNILYWGNTDLSSGGTSAINDLSDAKYDGFSVFLGEGSGIADDGTNYNTAIGKDALNSNTAGSSNTANGYRALYSNTTGNYNTANGVRALISNTTGNSNTANGYWALHSNTTGEHNTANGNRALIQNTTGNYNTANGIYALYYNVTGSQNTGIGNFAGPSFSSPTNLSNTTALGNGVTVTASNTISLGNTAVTSIKGQVAFTTFSDGRYKRNVQENVNGLDFIMGLRPVTYNVDVNALAEIFGEDMSIDKDGNRIKVQPSAEIIASRNAKESVRESGFIAQEVDELVNKLGVDFSGVDKPQNEQSMYGLRYAEFVVPLVKGMQEQQTEIKEQLAMIEELRKEIQELKNRK